MKPLYIFLILYALFITGFGDAIELAFTAIIPGAGLIIGMPLDVVINITMGAGLVLLLALNGMFHPKFGPAGIIASAIPGIDSLPIWLGLVVMAILQKTAEEKTGVIGSVAKVAVATKNVSLSNPEAALKPVHTIQTTTSSVASDIRPATNQPASSRPVRDLKSITLKAANDNRSYVQKAA